MDNKDIIKKIWLDDEAQAMAEYAALVSLVVISFVGFWALWSPVLRTYYDRLAFIMMFPPP